MKYILVILFFTSCNHSKEKHDSNKLFIELMRVNKIPEGARNIKGEKSVTSGLLSAVFSYKCNESYSSNILFISEFPEPNSFNKKFRNISRLGGNYLDIIEYTLNKDYTLYSKYFDEYRSKFKSDDCIILDGLIYPYYHTIIIDTISYNVFHTVDEIRD